jgi:hypothetical protein
VKRVFVNCFRRSLVEILTNSTGDDG